MHLSAGWGMPLPGGRTHLATQRSVNSPWNPPPHDRKEKTPAQAFPVFPSNNQAISSLVIH